MAIIFLTIFSCQPKEQVELCMGDYYTEEEASEKLKQYAGLYTDALEWKNRAEMIRNNIITGAGLDQINTADWEYPIKVTRRNRKSFSGYTVENLALEIKPGYYVTGNLYEPDSIQGRIPAIMCPHGHWGKLNDYGRFREDMQLRSASLARMGSVVFAYDMYGYGEDSKHYHRDKEALKWQTFNSLRILDFLSSLQHVDTSRLAITGASGGGTQSFLLAAIDDRIDVSVPVVMVSAHFFGGCVCESGLPIHKKGAHETNNVEIAAAIAPKPLLLVSDGNDWTKNVPKVEYPYVQNVYRLFDAKAKVENAHFADEGHDYGISKRRAAYAFLAKHLNLDYNKVTDTTGAVNENFVVLQDTTALKVYPDRALAQDL